MLSPWQFVSKICSLKFTYQIDFDFDYQKILEEYNNAKTKLTKVKHPSIGVDHDGGWETIALYSETGGSGDVMKNINTNTVPTEIIKYFPYTHGIIKSLLDKYNCVPRRIRFSNLKAQKNINWHTDWDECIQHGNSRLHIPLISNDICKNIMCHEIAHWRPGGLFYGDYSFPHQVKNPSSNDRLHLIIDLKKPKNLFINSENFVKEENKKIKYKKIIVTIFKILYLLPKKLIRLIAFK